ncbi:MAG: class I SAM-dependent methyltransferase [Candidatus Korarchaeota archaeon]|nr:class I SAM-dependent methyltransferase [Candidatus Korarchaeota archaeon]
MNYGPASKYYDLFASKEDISFYKEMAVKHGRKALDLGVGTGRVALELARAKVTVLGIDNSKYMLDVARQKLKKEKPSTRKRITLKLGDMRNFSLKETFPFIYIASSTFEHCITEKDQERCLTSVYNALGSEGVLAFDISQPRPEKPETSWWIDRKELNSKEIVRTIFSRRKPQTNVISVNLFFDVYEEGKFMERYYEYGKARISSKEEIEKILETVRFKVNHTYGDFDKSAYDEKSQKAIFVVKK